MERKVRDGSVRAVIESCERHIKKYGYRKMTDEELDALFRGG